MVRVISISDEVYADLALMKNGKSFTELLKTLISECSNKGDAKSIIAFLKKSQTLSDESVKNITRALEKGRKTSNARNLLIE